jgi:hypothetical protein
MDIRDATEMHALGSEQPQAKPASAQAGIRASRASCRRPDFTAALSPSATPGRAAPSGWIGFQRGGVRKPGGRRKNLSGGAIWSPAERRRRNRREKENRMLAAGRSP